MNINMFMVRLWAFYLHIGKSSDKVIGSNQLVLCLFGDLITQ